MSPEIALPEDILTTTSLEADYSFEIPSTIERELPDFLYEESRGGNEKEILSEKIDPEESVVDPLAADREYVQSLHGGAKEEWKQSPTVDEKIRFDGKDLFTSDGRSIREAIMNSPDMPPSALATYQEMVDHYVQNPDQPYTFDLLEKTEKGEKFTVAVSRLGPDGFIDSNTLVREITEEEKLEPIQDEIETLPGKERIEAETPTQIDVLESNDNTILSSNEDVQYVQKEARTETVLEQLEQAETAETAESQTEQVPIEIQQIRTENPFVIDEPIPVTLEPNVPDEEITSDAVEIMLERSNTAFETTPTQDMANESNESTAPMAMITKINPIALPVEIIKSEPPEAPISFIETPKEIKGSENIEESSIEEIFKIEVPAEHISTDTKTASSSERLPGEYSEVQQDTRNSSTFHVERLASIEHTTMFKNAERPFENKKTFIKEAQKTANTDEKSRLSEKATRTEDEMLHDTLRELFSDAPVLNKEQRVEPKLETVVPKQEQESLSIQNEIRATPVGKVIESISNIEQKVAQTAPAQSEDRKASSTNRLNSAEHVPPVVERTGSTSRRTLEPLGGYEHLRMMLGASVQGQRGEVVTGLYEMQSSSPAAGAQILDEQNAPANTNDPVHELNGIRMRKIA